MPDPVVHVGPVAPDVLTSAVTRAGARLAGLDEAHAVVWYGGSVAEFTASVPDAVSWVQLPSAGVEAWVSAGILRPGRVVTSAAGCYADAVAEHSLALLLAAARHLPALARERTWTTVESATLSGATVAIVGAGGIGRSLIAMLAPLGARVHAVTRSGRDVPGAEASFAPDRLGTVLAAADYVVLAAPSTAETAAMIGAEQLAAMKPSAWLVNVARGSLVDTEALVRALDAGGIAGAALDVTDPEPLPDGHPLWDRPNVLITPHSANSERLLLPQLARRVEENTRRWLSGRDLDGVVDATAGY